ncbi:MAG: hypothetical protein II816_02085, partial [Elusimicrobia bacterium]|nr:hypothetical protein [Elusimicrobiota bacterium]
ITMIVVLAAVSVPIYKSYLSEVKLAEGYALLGAIKDAQENYYNEYGNFLYYAQSGGAWTSYEPVLGINARANKYFTSFCVCYSDGESGKKTPYYFLALVQLPYEPGIWNSDIPSNPNWLGLVYNTTLGKKFVDTNKDKPWYGIWW